MTYKVIATAVIFSLIATDLRANPMMKDLEIAFTAKEVTAFGGVSPAYLEKKGDKNVLRLVRNMNQRQAFLGLWRTTENFDIAKEDWA